MKATMTIEGKSYSEFPNMVQGDFGTDITFNLKQDNGSVYNVTDFEVRFKAKKYGESTNQINGLCVLTDSTSGIVTYTLQDGDLSDTGKFETEVECSSVTKIITVKPGDLVIIDENPN